MIPPGAMKKLSLFLLACAVCALGARCELVVLVGKPKTTGSKAAVTIQLNNTFRLCSGICG